MLKINPNNFSFFLNLMVEAGELIPRGEEFFEDMGGHLLRGSNAEEHINSYLDSLPHTEKDSILKQIR